MTMQTKHKFTAAKYLAGMLCLVILLTTIHLTAWAVDLDGRNSLSVAEESQGLVQGADIQVDIYQLAAATEVANYDTYGYQFNSDFSSIKIAGEEDDAAIKEALALGTISLSDEQWEQIAQDACALIRSGVGKPYQTIALNNTAMDLPAGLYLIIARGAGLTDYWAESKSEKGKLITIAKSDTSEYSFSPSLVSLPTKEEKDGVISTADDFGPWIYEKTVKLKVGIEPLYGKIQIEKHIDQFSGNEEATFIFEVTAEGDFNNDGTIDYEYDNVASVYFTASTGTTSTAVLDHIRAGAEITSVEEIYPEPDNPNSRYVLSGFSGPEEPWIVKEGDDNVITFRFDNTLNDERTGGHGILNQFTYNGSTWDPKQIDSKHR